MLSVVRALPEINLFVILRRRGINPTFLMQWGVILLVLLGSFFAGLHPSLLFLALPLGVAGALLFWRQPALALVLTLQAGMIIPFSGPGGVNLTMVGAIALIALWIGGMLFEKQSLWFVSPETTKPALFFLFIVLLAFAVGQLPWYRTQAAPITAQIGGLMVFVVSIGAFLFVGNKFKDLRWISWFIWVFLGYGALHMVSWLIPRLGDLYSSRLFAQGATGSMFWAWVVILAFSQAVFNEKIKTAPRIALFVLVAATMYVAFVLNGDWKSGWMPAAIGMAVILLLRSWRFGYLLALMGIYPAIKIFSNALASDEYSYSTRVDAWTIVLNIVKVNPILGLGPANYYWYTPLFPIRGYAVNFNSHNQYIDLIAQTGVLGLLAFVWLMFCIGKVGWQLRNKVDSGFEKAYVYGALGGWVAVLSAAGFGDWILPFVYNVGLDGMRASILPWVFFGGLVALQIKHRDKE